ncbi:hypothetical protein [Vibrio vulnificus YJ016]|uniref:Uncharacterized protein n=1 Tax=Vibrio vulnificus (strain YJ016) TaxID=196600 RepID=Q7MNL6_VIBVY|nr:hypothetical protein [Vibrio vulnificus YJ016]
MKYRLAMITDSADLARVDACLAEQIHHGIGKKMAEAVIKFANLL